LLIGEGRFLDQVDDTPSTEVLAKAGIAPLKPGPRDGLALISHSCFSTALAAIGHNGAMTIWQSAQTAAALSLEEDINGAPDNPMVLAETGEILSGGGYLSPYVGVSLVAVNHALVQLAAQITARCSKLMFHRSRQLICAVAGRISLAPLLINCELSGPSARC